VAREAVSSGVSTEVVRGATWSIGASSTGVVLCCTTCSINTRDIGAVDGLQALIECTREGVDDGEKVESGEDEVEKHVELIFVSTMNLWECGDVLDRLEQCLV
jgi:hypothetical protein